MYASPSFYDQNLSLSTNYANTSEPIIIKLFMKCILINSCEEIDVNKNWVHANDIGAIG